MLRCGRAAENIMSRFVSAAVDRPYTFHMKCVPTNNYMIEKFQLVIYLLKLVYNFNK